MLGPRLGTLGTILVIYLTMPGRHVAAPKQGGVGCLYHLRFTYGTGKTCGE
jgi:hypothetical protein